MDEIFPPDSVKISQITSCPLALIVLMADLDLWVNDSQLSNFADDTQSVLIADSEEELRKKALTESQAVVAHFSANNLVNNPDKAALLYNNKGKAGNITMQIAGENITSVDQNAPKVADRSERLLGLQVAPGMEWGLHVDHVIKKLNQRMFMLRRLRDKVPLAKLKIVADAIFLSEARYGIAVYLKPRLHDDPTSENNKKIQTCQNKMLRLLAKKTVMDKISSESLAKRFGMMSINQLTSYHYLVECYNVINFGSSEKLRKKLMPKNPNSKNLTVPLVKKTSCRGFSFHAARLWNKLPVKIRIKAMRCDEKSNQKIRLDSLKNEIKAWIMKGGVPFT